SCALVNLFMVCPPKWSAGGLADQDEILPLITAISWRTYETLAHNECWRERARLPWRRFAKSCPPECETNPPAHKDRGSGVREPPLSKALPWLRHFRAGVDKRTCAPRRVPEKPRANSPARLS